MDVEPKINTSFVGELLCLRAEKSKILPELLFSILNTEFFKILINREKTGQTSHIYAKDIQNLHIPILPPEKQQEIVTHIQNLRNQAKQLEQDAEQILADAKREIERMILGD